MDTMGSPSWEERLTLVSRLVMDRLLAFLDPPEGLRGDSESQKTRRRTFWNELGQAVARELPAGANREEIGNMLTEAVNECVASRNYRVWPGIGEIATPLRQLAKDWHERQKANDASRRALPAPAPADPLAEYRDEGWTIEAAQRWVDKLARDRNHACQAPLLGIARAALERCQARAGQIEPDEMQHQQRHYFGGPDPRDAAAR